MNRAKPIKKPDQLREELEAAAAAHHICRNVPSLEKLIRASFEYGAALEDTAETAARSPLTLEAA